MKSDFDANEYLGSLYSEWITSVKFPGETGLKRMQLLLKLLGNPQKKYPVIHVAGTSGKGSVVAIIASILTQCGYKTGSTFSPHVQTVRERIQIDGKLISDKSFNTLIHKIQPVIEDASTYKYGKVTYFEALIASVFQYFADKKVDIAVVETGLGGTYDGTNVVNSLLSVITPIGFDHTHILGKSLISIARNKTGIIKKSNKLCIVAKQKKQVIDVICSECRKNNISIVIQDKDFFIEVKQTDTEGVIFNYINKNESIFYKDFKCSLLGLYQAQNAGLAITTCLVLRKLGFTVLDKYIKEGLKKVTIPGRLEIIQKSNRTIILDGAHNVHKMRALTRSLKEIWPGKKFTIIFACKREKDAKSMLKLLIPFTDEFIFNDLSKRPAMYKAEDLVKLCKALSIRNIAKEYNVNKALVTAQSDKKNNLILITGSLYLVGEARKILSSHS